MEVLGGTEEPGILPTSEPFLLLVCLGRIHPPDFCPVDTCSANPPVVGSQSSPDPSFPILIVEFYIHLAESLTVFLMRA